MMILATGFALLLAGGQGEVYVARGDTLVISGTAIQLHGVELDTGSRQQAETARQQLQAIVQDRFVTCRLTGEMQSNRRLGRCTADGEDIAAALDAHVSSVK
ncbi:hypothetical protein R3X27_12020 [Tropicimonas sp. TH_r6]|uniref:thermonuclease family protein n=1 Tax=Tropicimonas sp. TH_r6 TaxID=3082085 RepID=UPI0029529E6E|nr:hypothetical protein [Tropicimonas sp. TH_r6]MDV7143410.1 hypothetical protein [Tropicimonas sp. TH_r6]